MKYLISIFLVVAFFATSYAQTYKTYKKVNDSTFVETRSYEVEEQDELTKAEVVQNMFSEIDRWVDIENRHALNELAARRVYNALIVQQGELVPDTSYLAYNKRWDGEYSYPELARDEGNAIIYDSKLLIGDTTYSGQIFLNAVGGQTIRLQETVSNYPVRFIRGNKILRLGTGAVLPPQLNSYVDLIFINENRLYRNYFALAEGKVVRLQIAKQE